LVARRFSNRRKWLVTLFAVWLALVICGIERFTYHAKMSEQAGLGQFPHPIRTMKNRIRHLNGTYNAR
jgi:hypothetical protein